jgi:hypothetical protein
MKRCETIVDVVAEAMKIVEEDRSVNSYEECAGYYFRGESLNFHHKGDNTALLETDFPCYLNQDQGYIDHERDLIKENMISALIILKQNKTKIKVYVKTISDDKIPCEINAL